MSSTPTTRYGLIKPTPGTGEIVNVADLNTNSDVIDAALGAKVVNDGTIIPPGEIRDGMIVQEKTSGISYIYVKNNAGIFNKAYLTYPYNFYAFSATNAYAISDATLRNWGYTTFFTASDSIATPKNSSAAHLNGAGFWVCPVKGIYKIRTYDRWQANITGARGAVITLNGTADVNNSAQNLNASSQNETYVRCETEGMFNVGDVIGHQVFQNSGGALNLDSNISVQMISAAVL